MNIPMWRENLYQGLLIAERPYVEVDWIAAYANIYFDFRKRKPIAAAKYSMFRNSLCRCKPTGRLYPQNKGNLPSLKPQNEE
ncbi:hypothetical protein SK3146_03752 [Paenibacillus konkukensis]|uniref:Uncharacterized protein n=1 Tax=Paenibacillus konkukensis TaxID=2020716 RepID=A0ABY4RQU3_9BACL|nr:hypothetical protein [Paenibacillus konkukensis]UQZ84498.1 hypothetical protein SK3146_03752 [Paenibacillus konkukensis]